MSGHCAPSDLKTILCPIFASNEREQSQFYSAFDSYFAFYHSVVDAKTSEPVDEILSVVPNEPKPMAVRKWPYALGASLIIALALTLAIVLAPKPQGPALQSEPEVVQQEPAGEPQTEDRQAGVSGSTRRHKR